MATGTIAVVTALDSTTVLKDDAIRFGAALPVNPFRALLDEINRTAGHVTWLGLKVAEAPTDDALLDTHRPWLQLYQQERRHLTRVAGEAVKLGLAEREVQVLEAQATVVARALERVLGRLELTDSQRLAAPRLLREELLALEAVEVTGEERVVDTGGTT